MDGPKSGEYEQPWDPKERLGEAEEAVAEETGVPVDDPAAAVGDDAQSEPSPGAEPPGAEPPG